MIGLKTGQRRDVRGNVTTFQGGSFPTSRRSGQRRDVSENSDKQRRDVGYQRRDVGYQRRDVPERCKNQRRDVKSSRCDVPEEFKIDIATLESHIATLQRRLKMHIQQPMSKI